VPGIGKTGPARATAEVGRLRLPPHPVHARPPPSDITGVSIFDSDRKDFVFKRGPIFSNIILADEINRATPAHPGGALEAMNEKPRERRRQHPRAPSPSWSSRRRTRWSSRDLPAPESQLDRFLMILRMGYPTPREERQIIQSRAAADPVESLQAVVSADDVNRLCERVNEVKIDDAVTNYVVEIANRTRADRTLVAGVSPRGRIHLTRAARAHALVDGRDYATPDDIKAVAATSSRTASSRSGRARRRTAARPSGQILRKILQEIPVPQ
jgi:MoxR-like ATPase